MAKHETLDQLTASVAHAELIPANRALAAGEIELLDDLAARLRQHFFGDRADAVRDLLRRVSAVRTGKREAGAPVPAKQSLAVKKPAKAKKTPPAQKAMAVQARFNGADSPEPAEQPATSSSSASDEPPRKRAEKNRSLGHMHSELSEMAAKKELGRKGRQRLEEIVNEAASLIKNGPDYRRLYERALQIQKKTLTPPRKGKRRGGPAGLVQNPGLSQGGREVLSGLPSSRRGY